MPERLHILLVDDSLPDLLLAKEAFEHHTDTATITTCTCAEDALLHLQKPDMSLPDVVITDLNMPGMTGLDLIRSMKADERLKRIPVVFLSTSNQTVDIEDAYSLHASAYLVKASSFPDFMAQIEHLLTFWQTVKFSQQRP